jgi:two-component system, OmpR family, heavy metal sensor histidine kinase CusS
MAYNTPPSVMDALAIPAAHEPEARFADQARLRMLVLGSGFRLIAALILLLLNLIFCTVNPAVSWWPQVPAMLAYALIAGLVFMLRRRRVITHVAPVAALLDLVLPYLVIRWAIDLHPEVGPFVAGLALGIFAVIVSLCGLTLQRSYIVLAAVVATIEEYLLLCQVGAPCARMFLPPGVLALAAGVGFILADRTRRLLNETAGSEATRHQLANTRAQYDHLSRLQQDKDSLVQLIVHDMKGPISAAILSLEYLGRELGRQPINKDVTEAIEDALTSSKNVANMISQILDTAKLEEGRITLHLESLPVRQLLEGACRHASSRAQSKSIRIDVDAPDDLTVMADARLFPRSLDNLVSNATRYTPDEGRVLLVAVQVGEELVISIHNTGSPIPAPERDRIFGKFQGDGEARRMLGWGPGLYFCRLLVEAHHGRISVEDVEGWPTSFVIRLPAHGAKR